MNSPLVSVTRSGPALTATASSLSCPLCHTVSSGAAGDGSWACSRCGQKWDAVRLETAAAYATYVAAQPER